VDEVSRFIEETKNYIREHITELRMQRGISEYKLSKSIGKNDGYIQKISAKKSLPSMDAFIDICVYFEITPEEFFCCDEEKRKKYENSEKLIEMMHILEQLNEEEIKVLKQTALLFLKSKGN